MDSNDQSALHQARLSSERTEPISLTVRNLNVVHPPQRRSSLKSLPAVRNSRKKPSRVPESGSIKQSRNTNHHRDHISSSILKVAKTRLNIENVPAPHGRKDLQGKPSNVSVHSLVSEDLGRWKSSDPGTLRGSSVRSNVLDVSSIANLNLQADLDDSSVSRSSTALSHSTTKSISHQPQHRRESVRQAVTKAFSTLNRKKRNRRSASRRASPDADPNGLAPVTVSSFQYAKQDTVRVESHDSGIFVVADLKYASSLDGAQDADDSQTTRESSYEASDNSSHRFSPLDKSLMSDFRSADVRASSESLLSQLEAQNLPSAHVVKRSPYAGCGQEEPLTLRVRLAAKAELKEANLTSDDPVWAMVQIHGEVAGIESQASNPGIEASIAIAIIFDNSCLHTMKDIEKTILEIIGLAGQLDAQVDRLGVFCTAFSHLAEEGDPDCCVYSLSQSLDRMQLSNQLKGIAKQSQHGYYLEVALNQAAQALHELSSSPNPAVKRNIIVISPNPIGLANYTEGFDEAVSIHLFNPGLVPFDMLDPLPRLASQWDTETTRMNQQHGTSFSQQERSAVRDGAYAGWIIDATSCVSRDCSLHGSHSLCDVVAHARAQTDIGAITNVAISITPGADVSSIDEVVGKLDYSVLLPGQMISIPIKVQLRSLACRLSHMPLPLSPRRSVTEAITDLELTLGEHLSELFRVQVRYSHSKFPDNTTVIAQESCWLRRTLKRRRAREDDSRRESVYECTVQRQLALSLAGLGPPADALNALEMEFDGKPVPIYCSRFVEAVKDRLRHRICQSSHYTILDLATESESYEEKLRKFVDERQRQELSTNNSPATVVRRRIVHTPDMELHDTARRIWQHIRKTSKPEREICDELELEDSRAQEPDARMEEIRKMVLRNRRKMSTETLKSLARDYTRFSNELEGVDELCDDVD